MQRNTTLLRAALALAALLATFATMAQKRIMVFTDPHLLAPGLFQPSSTALQNDLAGDNKMFDLSNEIMQAMVDRVLAERPDAVLVAGDLTKQGAKLSHLAMADLLHQITDAGIKVCVIPGNHDVNNSQAVRYDGANRYPAATVTSSEFVDIYAGMGYATALARDNNSLSYVAEPVAGLRLIAVDDNRCTARDRNPSLNANGLTMGTRSWVLAQIDDARQHGKQVLVMMHHNLIEHIDDQAALSSDGQVVQAEAIRNEFMQHGVQLLLTGHMHISNITTWHNQARTDSIVEITTGSLIAYPCHYRTITLSPDLGTWTVTTEAIDQLAGKPDFAAYAEQRMAGSARATISSIVWHNWDTFSSKLQEYQSMLGGATFTQDQVTEIATRNMADAVTELNKTMAEGNENEKDGQAIRNHLTSAVTDFANDLLSDANFLVRMVAVPVIVDEFNNMIATPLNSALSDCTNYGTDRANVTDDLHPVLHIAAVPVPDERLAGDLNGDRQVDVADVNLLLNVALGKDSDPQLAAWADLDSSGVVDVIDLNSLINLILNH